MEFKEGQTFQEYLENKTQIPFPIVKKIVALVSIFYIDILGWFFIF
jgi:hypothetical protein